MRTRIGFLNVSILALFCVSAAVISGCSSPDGTDTAAFSATGQWGLAYPATFEMGTSYSNAANQTVNPPISAIIAPGSLPDAGDGYNEFIVFMYDPVAHTVTVGEPNPATDGGGPEVPGATVFTLNSSNQVTVMAATPSFAAIASTSCGVTGTSGETIQFSADGSTLVLTEAESMVMTDNNAGSGPTCTQYLTQEQAKVEASAATDISNYVTNFSVFLSTGAINVSDMPSLTGFNLNLSVNGTRISTSTDVPAAAQGRPSSVVKFQIAVTDAHIAQMIHNLMTGVQK